MRQGPRTARIVAVVLFIAVLVAGCSSRWVSSPDETARAAPPQGAPQPQAQAQTPQKPPQPAQAPVPRPAPAPQPAQPPRQPGAPATQSSSGGAVTVQVTWLADRTDSIVFDVALETHSVDLDGYDLKALAVLRDTEGKEYKPASWNAPPGGHHRSGRLTFARPESLTPNASFQLVIRDVAGVKERAFRW